MRILALASNVPVVPLQNELKAAESIANEQAETTRVGTPRIATTSTVPIVVLDTEAVSDHLAARLCISFLGHVLFLKNQVPFPIVQLARMPTSDNSTRASKKRHELLNSFDCLASHLYTTFIALSTALALRGSPETPGAATETTVRVRKERVVSRAFFSVVLGPTVGTAKSRVIVCIDGLETRVWGLREDTIPDNATETRDGSSSEDEVVDGESDTNEEESEESSEEDDRSASGFDEDDDTSPPSSRSPSPSLSSDSDSPSSTSLLNASSRSSQLRVEDPESVRAAERLLSRTLASACAEGDGYGLASEMAPTQIHVLLRAPRRFGHPSWIPRQNLCASMDSCLSEFLVESGQKPPSCDTTHKKRTKASKVQGVWVRCRSDSSQFEISEKDMAEEDELIWWSWDGKLVGFTEW